MKPTLILGLVFLLGCGTAAWSQDLPSLMASQVVCDATDLDGNGGDNDADQKPVLYGGAEYLLWWLKSTAQPPLLTSGSITDPGVAGALGQPSTQILFGGNSTGGGSNQGGRFTLGSWLTDDWAVEGTGFFLADRGSSKSFVNNGDPFGTSVLARPFVDQTALLPDAQAIAFAGQAGALVVSQNHRLFGVEANVRTARWSVAGFRIGFLAGFRFLELDDSLDIASLSQDLTGQAFFSSIASTDHFATHNRFYGGQLGCSVEYRWGSLSVQAQEIAGLGGTDQQVNIAGTTLAQQAGGTLLAAPTGLLAQPTNIGDHSRTYFTFVNEIRAGVAYSLTEHLAVRAGYTLLYDSSVVRPGSQIDFVASTPTLMGPLPAGQVHPAFTFHATDFWAQGLTCGVELQF